MVRGSGKREKPLAGGAGRLSQQAQEDGAAVGKGRKLGHVADSLGKGDGGGPASKQARNPLRGLKSSVVRVEGEEDPGAAPQALRHLLDPLGAQGSDGGDAPAGEGKPVEDALGHDREGRCGAETPKSKHRLGAGQSLEPGRPVGVYGPPDKPADKTAGGVGTTTIPANRPPRSVNSPQSLSRPAVKPSDARASRSPLPGA